MLGLFWKCQESGPGRVRLHRGGVTSRAAVFWLFGAVFSGLAAATPVQLQNGTATFSQGGEDGVGPYSPEMAIDGITSGPYGWPIDHFPGPQEYTTNETAVWETVSDLGPSLLTFTMQFLANNSGHLLGRFRLSVTTDDRSTYADGLASGGNVTANWTVLKNLVVQGPPGMTFTNLPDDSVLAGGVVPGQGIYNVTAVTNLAGITGIRLEALQHPSLPHGGGPGFAANGNFVLSEIVLDASAPPVLTVAIDIEPGVFPNKITWGGKGRVPVAILSTSTFNVVDLDVNTVKFAGASSEKFRYEDVNSDGLTDLVFRFRIDDLELNPCSTQATLTGNLRNGQPFSGTDSVLVVPPKQKDND